MSNVKTKTKKVKVKGDVNARLQKYDYITFTFNTTYNKNDITVVMNSVVSATKSKTSYAVEVTPKGKVHVHGYCPTADWQDLKKYIEITDHTPVAKPCFHLQGWKEYITKNNGIITHPKIYS